MQLTTFLACVAASSFSTGCIAAPAPNVHEALLNVNELAPQNHLEHATGGPPAHAAQNGRLEANWSFLLHEGKEVDFLYVNFYNGGSGSPTCSDTWSITDLSRQGTLYGRGFAGPNCAAAGTPTYVIFDGNRPGNTVSTYGSANGVNCGWNVSPDHQQLTDSLTQTDDYYLHCAW